MSASDHLSPHQFNPAKFGGWQWSEHGFGHVDDEGKTIRNTPWDANISFKSKAPDTKVSGFHEGMYKFVPSDSAMRVN